MEVTACWSEKSALAFGCVTEASTAGHDVPRTSNEQKVVINPCVGIGVCLHAAALRNICATT